MQVETISPDETRRLGRILGELATGSLCIAIDGDLGAGKTVFVQGLAIGLGVDEDQYVTSPTYTYINEYKGRIPLFHVDLYRIEGPGDLESIGFFDLFTTDAIVAVEWASKAKNELTADIHIVISVKGEKKRLFSFFSDGKKTDDMIKRCLVSFHEGMSMEAKTEY